MSEWRTVSIADVAEIFDGPHATPTKTDLGPWFLSISSLDRGRLNLNESAHLSEDDFKAWTRRVTPHPGDVLFSYETRLGEAALMPDDITACLGRRMALLRPKQRVDSRFLLYAYLAPEFQSVIEQRKVHGATVDRIPLNEMGNWPIRIPSLGDQRAIAAILGAIDDKITLNEQVGTTALDLAGLRYKAGVASDPEARSVPLGEAATWTSGGTPRTSEPSYWGGDIPWISALSLKSPWIADSDRRLTKSGAASGTRLAQADTVLFVVRGSSLKEEFRIGLAVREVAFGQDCKALTPLFSTGHVLFHAIRSHTPQILDMVDETSIGAGRLATDLMMKLEVRLPGPSASLPDELKALDETAINAEAENRSLAELRDALLPKLVSGEIRVREAERLVGDAV